MSEIAKNSSITEERILKPNLERNVSGELDVFEATRYFSDFNNEPTTIEYSRIHIQKQSIVAETRQNRVHPETEDQLRKPRAVIVVKPQEKVVTRGGGGKLTSFLKSLFRSASSKKSKSTTEVETPRGEKRRRKSCVVTTTRDEVSSPITGAGAWRLNARRRSFDVNDSKRSDQKLNIRFCESLCSEKKVEYKDRNAGDENDVNGGCESDSSSESDLFELDLFAKAKP
ncbi:unnamed protein product [Arabis nemorensis]|uniref:Uncharacterized protein n=1 Tax=Arabis nemorensis TaxID=586526 RepID=A0A565AQA6_9BRAS|nr:unnamed protein product [Arabis nemorensis]